MSNSRCGALVAAAIVVALSGCATTQQDQEDPVTFGRVDCKRAADHPELMPEFEQAKAVCMNRAEAQGEAASATMGYGGGLGGSISRAVTSVTVRDKTAVSCMAERGYLLKRRSEHEAFCAAYGPKPPVVAEVPKPAKPKPKPAPKPTVEPAAAAPAAPSPSPAVPADPAQ